MIAPTLFTLALVAAAPETASGPRPGLYVERTADGSPACLDDDANRFDLHLAPNGEPPHARSRNVGNLGIRISDVSGRFILRASSNPWLFGGGTAFTVGVERDGVLDSQLTGELVVELAAGQGGDLRLVTGRYDPAGRRGNGRPGEVRVFAEAGADADGRALRPFSYCPD
ncbi:MULTISPECIES: hypothetical protein [Maricaulis]|uniref:Uncharacterized protein n=1 Tax=Maricaulis maris TaxID=74318 RepID=A0A495DLY9_9PROT|nr:MULTISPECIES: hypothetical protein [Maricaulis]RKR03933.1 hypothetical protein C7435_0376 [Maricaulis maris]